MNGQEREEALREAERYMDKVWAEIEESVSGDMIGQCDKPVAEVYAGWVRRAIVAAMERGVVPTCPVVLAGEEPAPWPSVTVKVTEAEGESGHLDCELIGPPWIGILMGGESLEPEVKHVSANFYLTNTKDRQPEKPEGKE